MNGNGLSHYNNPANVYLCISVVLPKTISLQKAQMYLEAIGTMLSCDRIPQDAFWIFQTGFFFDSEDNRSEKDWKVKMQQNGWQSLGSSPQKTICLPKQVWQSYNNTLMHKCKLANVFKRVYFKSILFILTHMVIWINMNNTIKEVTLWLNWKDWVV